jgi:hypothetical protein
VPGTWHSKIIYNQSLAGICHRWLLTRFCWDTGECRAEETPRVAAAGTVRWLVLTLDLVFGVLVFGACGAPFQQIEEVDAGDRRVPVEHSMILLLMLLLSPMSSMAHFGLLLVPGFLLARAAHQADGRSLKWLLAAGLCMAMLASKDPLGKRLYTLCLWCGSVTFHALILLAGCLVLRFRETAARQSVAPSEPLWRWRRLGNRADTVPVPAPRSTRVPAPVVQTTGSRSA